MATTYRINRTGNATEAAAYAASSATFGSAVRNTRAATLLVAHHPGEGISQYVVVPDNKRNPERVAGNAASSVGGRAERLEDPVALDTSSVMRMVADPDTNAARETQAGADPHQIARYVREGLPEGYWVAVSMRPPTKSERNVARRWYDHRLGNTATHHSRSGEVLVSSIWAGGPDRSGVADVINGVVAVMPGFDVEARARAPWGARSVTAVCVLLALLGWVGVRGTAPVGDWWSGVPRFSSWLWLAYGAMAVVAALAWVGVLPTPASRARRAIRRGNVPMPPRRMSSVRRPRKERLDADGNIRSRAFDGDYPLSRDDFFVGPSVVLGLVSPHTGEATGAATTKMRQVPTALRSNIGPVIGTSGGVEVHVSQLDRFGGVATFGQAGSGKSVVITNIFGYDTALRCRARAMGSSWSPLVTGDTGARNTLIAFENKGRDGVAVYMRFAQHFGDDLTVVEVADPTTPAIDMFGTGTAAQRAAFFVDSMVYAFGEQAVGNRSQGVLNSVFAAALLATAADVELANKSLPVPMDPRFSAMELADVLLCGRGDAQGIALAGAMTSRAVATQDPELMEAVTRLSPMYGDKVTASQRRTLVEAPQNKVALLLKNKGWWDRGRARGTWDAIIASHASVVVNAGQSLSGEQVDSTLTKTLMAMMTYGLQKAIERNCSGWGEQDRSVSIFSDELSLLAGQNNSDVFQWFRNQGRSFGVRAAFATQIPEQLEPVLRTTVTGFTTFLWLGQADPGVAGVAAADLSADGTEWTVADITTLEPYHGILRCSVNKQRQPSVPVRTLFYGEGRLAEFVTEQGLG